MARGYADHLSEIDVTVYLEPDAYAHWTQEDHPVLPEATRIHDTIYDADGILYDIKVADIAAERQAMWDHVALWDASYAEILYDPQSTVRDLLGSKLGQLPDVKEARDLLFDCWWHYHLAANAWFHRGDLQQVQLLLNSAVHLLASAVYLANNEYIPHEKWLIHLTRSLTWQPENWNERLAKAMESAETTEEALRNRQSVIAGLKAELDRFMDESYVRCRFPGMKRGSSRSKGTRTNA